VPKPSGSFVLLEGAEYEAAYQAGKNATKAYHAKHPECAGKEIHHIKPIKFGGSPTDEANMIALDPETHYTVNAFWRRIQRSVE
jgi:hypothetical protein